MTTLRITPASIDTPVNPAGLNQSPSTTLGIPTSQSPVQIAGWFDFWNQDPMEKYQSAIQDSIGRNNPDDLLKVLQSLNQLPASQFKDVVTSSSFANFEWLVERATLVASDMSDATKIDVEQRKANASYATKLLAQLTELRKNLIFKNYPDISPTGSILKETYSLNDSDLFAFYRKLNKARSALKRVILDEPKSPTGKKK
jgi:hypothetical protein